MNEKNGSPHETFQAPPLRGALVIVAILLTACGRPSAGRQQEAGLPAAVSVDNVEIRGTDADFMVFYRTRTSVRDEKAQTGEIPSVWNTVVRPRLTASTMRVIMVPEDSSRVSVSLAFSKSAEGEWIAQAPWKIVITTR